MVCTYRCMAQVNTEHTAKTARVLEQIRGNTPQLRQFCSLLPKGGDLHHHAMGAVFAETLIKAAANGTYYIDLSNGYAYKQNPEPGNKNIVLLSEAIKSQANVDRIINLWSVRFYNDCQGPNHDHFFGIFQKIQPIYKDNMAEVLKALATIAMNENVSYIETMIEDLDAMGKVNDMSAGLTWDSSLPDSVNMERAIILLHKKGLEQEVQNAKRNIEAWNQQVTQWLPAGRTFWLRYQAYALRVLPPQMVFAQMVYCYELAKSCPLVVGVNLVAPEDNRVSLGDYNLHMRMERYLQSRYPGVNLALHAGELTVGLVAPTDLTDHISQAVHVAGARRIGHGVDIGAEQDAAGVLLYMRTHHIPVEISLGSNEFILGVKGQEHPLMMYVNSGVPVVLASDDAGILRTDLTEQYVLAISRYPELKYPAIKQFVYNSIQYSFLNEQEKRRVMADLEVRFKVFEKRVQEMEYGK